VKNIVILGSSRIDGNTRNVVDKLKNHLDFDLIDLSNYNISYYDYEHKNQNDDFLMLVRNIINNYDTFIFATPVYWYSMSGIMKVFLTE
jgi:multimeric flavodoxin WrbA